MNCIKTIDVDAEDIQVTMTATYERSIYSETWLCLDPSGYLDLDAFPVSIFGYVGSQLDSCAHGFC